MKKTPDKNDPEATTVDVASILGELHASFEHADSARSTALASLASARTARGYMLQRRRDDLASYLGAHAPEVTALEASVNMNARLVRTISLQSHVAAKPPPAAVPDETIVHGFVRDSAGQPVASVKVALAPPNGDVIATGTSGKDGHFVLRYKAKTKADVPDRIELRVHDKRQPTPIEVERGTGVAVLMVHLED